MLVNITFWLTLLFDQHKCYTEQLDLQLQQGVQLQCDNILCDDAAHLHYIDRDTKEILKAITDSAWDNLESSKGTTGDQSCRRHTIPGWNERVRPFQNEARFWYSLWVSTGKPRQSSVPGVDHDLFTNMKTSKNQYHYAVRRTQRSLDKIESDKVVSKLGSPEMFEEIKNQCKNRSSNVSTVIDDVHGSENISNHFKNIYEELYNEQFEISETTVREIRDNVACNTIEAERNVALITADLVKAAVKKLKPDKSDVAGSFTSDCLKAAPDIFF